MLYKKTLKSENSKIQVFLNFTMFKKTKFELFFKLV